jgi:cation diffusion facilitator family transporter
MGIASDQLNEQEQRRRQKAMAASAAVGVVLMFAKFWAHNLTNSQAIFSDATESIVNVIAALMGLWVIWYSNKPIDEDHPYGHGKVEFFSAAFEGGLIAFASVVICTEALRTWMKGEPLHELNLGLLVVGAAGIANLVLGLFLKNRGKELGSAALRADGAHVIADFWTSAAVIIGLGLTAVTGWHWLDHALALGVGLWLAWTGFRLVVDSFGGLMDREDLEVLNSLARSFEKSLQPGFIQIHHVRVIRSGWYHHIDAHVVMPEFWDVGRVHEAINDFEKAVIKHYEYGGDMNFHVDPCRRAYCRVCEVKDCPIRQEPFVSAMPVVLEHLRSPVEPKEFLRKRR